MVRKKLRGMLALLLSLSMAMGLLGGTALAAEGEEGGASPEAVAHAPEPPSRPIAILSDNSSASIPRSFFLTIFSSSPFHGMISRQGSSLCRSRQKYIG